MTLGMTYCRMYASIPGPNIPIDCPLNIADASVDFTPYLGTRSKTLFQKMFSGRQLKLGFDYAIGYAVINPGVRLRADNGQLTLHTAPFNSTARSSSVTLSGDTKTVTVNEAVQRGQSPWGLVLERPSYRMGASLVPLLEAEIGIDLGVYEWNYKFGPYSVGALTVNLGRFQFDAHQGTQSRLQYELGTRREP